MFLAACVTEVERRGVSETGIYRISGSVSDMNKLKRCFEDDPLTAEQLIKVQVIQTIIKQIMISSLTGGGYSCCGWIVKTLFERTA